MKLYTEEQVKEAIELAREKYPNNITLTTKGIMHQLTPIELPTDEEIDPNGPYESNSGPDVFNSDYDIGYHNGWKAGAKYVLDKIKGGEK
jgi:hypothetical protein